MDTKFENWLKSCNCVCVRMHVCGCACVCVHACVCVCTWVSPAIWRCTSAWMYASMCMFAYVPVSVCRVRQPAAARPPNRGEFENLPPALTFQPPACQPCYVWYFSWRWGNGKQWPRLPGDTAVVTAEQQHGHFPQCYSSRHSSDSPQIASIAPPHSSFLSFNSPTLHSALVLHFNIPQVVPLRHYLREIRRDQR